MLLLIASSSVAAQFADKGRFSMRARTDSPTALKHFRVLVTYTRNYPSKKRNARQIVEWLYMHNGLFRVFGSFNGSVGRVSKLTVIPHERNDPEAVAIIEAAIAAKALRAKSEVEEKKAW